MTKLDQFKRVHHKFLLFFLALAGRLVYSILMEQLRQLNTIVKTDQFSVIRPPVLIVPAETGLFCEITP